MAEFVEFRCEEWTSELETLERIRLFEAKEIKTLVTKRREFEYKIERRSKSKEDFLRYIQFEVDFLRIINTRREKTGINISRGTIEMKQINRVIRLFKQIIFRHPDDIKLWMSLFKFCSDVKQHSVVSKMLARMLQHNSGKEDLWVYAAKWTMEHEKSVSNARQFLTKGLRHHPSSEKLYLELFKIELEHMKKETKLKKLALKKKRILNHIKENVISGKVVEVIYSTATNILETAEFKVGLLNIAKPYTESVDIQKRIIRDLVTLHSKEEITWDAIAKREYDGFNSDWRVLKCGSEPMDIENNKMTQEEEKSPIRGRIQNSIDVYEEAVKTLQTEKMWNYYLDHVTNIHNDTALKATLPIFKLKIYQNAIEGALNASCLSEHYLIRWIKTLEKSGKKNPKVEELLLKGVNIYPESLPLWHAQIRYYLCLDEGDKAIQLFREATGKVPQCTALWELIIEYLKLKNMPVIEEIFKDAIQQRGDVAQTVKPLYLKWLADNKGIVEARRVFDSSVFQHPPNLKLYKVMAELEEGQPEYSKKHIRRCYDLATIYFGHDNPGVWLDFINWEMKKGDATKVHEIHSTAMKTLSADRADEFMAEYNFIKINAS